MGATIKISFDEAKRQWTLEQRGLDFADAVKIFAGDYLEFIDDRYDYGEDRYIVYGELDARTVVIVWTPRGGTRRVISMRHVHDEELKDCRRALD